MCWSHGHWPWSLVMINNDTTSETPAPNGCKLKSSGNSRIFHGLQASVIYLERQWNVSHQTPCDAATWFARLPARGVRSATEFGRRHGRWLCFRVEHLVEFIQRISKRYEYGCVYRLLDIDGDIDCNFFQVGRPNREFLRWSLPSLRRCHCLPRGYLTVTRAWLDQAPDWIFPCLIRCL